MQTLLVTAESIGDLIEAANAALTPLTSHYIRGVTFLVAETARSLGGELVLIITYGTGGNAMSSPYQLIVYDGRTAAEAVGYYTAASSSNPGLFWSQPFAEVSTEVRRTRRNFIAALYSSDKANGDSNWLVAPLPSGLVVDPLVMTELDVGANVVASVLTPSAGAVVWELVLRNSTLGGPVVRGALEIRSQHNGTAAGDATDVVYSITGTGWTGTTGSSTVTVSCDVSGSGAGQIMRLIVTPAVTGWAAAVVRTVFVGL